MRDWIVLTVLVIVAVVTWRATEAIGWAFVNYQTAAAMWLATGVVIGIGGTVLAVGVNAIQDGLRASMYDRSGGRGRVVDVTPGAHAGPAMLKDHAAAVQHYAAADFQRARAADLAQSMAGRRNGHIPVAGNGYARPVEEE